MISVNVDLSKASDSEKEAFLTLPHVAGAIDTLANVERNDLMLLLRISGDQETRHIPSIDSATSNESI